MNWFDSAKEILAKWKSDEVTAQRESQKFTPRCRQVLTLASQEAQRLRHNFTGTEHLLLGLIALGNGVACNVLKKCGLNLDAVRNEIESYVGMGFDTAPDSTPYTPRTKKVIDLAEKEAKAMGHAYVGTEHLLLALISEGDGVASRVLNRFNVDIEQTRKDILQKIASSSSMPGEKQNGTT